jgi:acetyltransferase-like isoleucine patch superfamily enzyme
MKKYLKSIIATLSIVFVSPCILITLIEKSFSSSEKIFQFFAQLLSILPGTPGSFIRVAYYRCTIEKCSVNISIGFGSYFAHRNIIVEDHVSIGAYCIIGCCHIEEKVLLASRVSITSGKNQHSRTNEGWATDLVLTQLRIGNNSWIGEGAVIVSDISQQTTVAAGSVVTRTFQPSVIIGGNPCHIISRNS